MNLTGRMIIGLPGTTLSDLDKKWIENDAVAGVILFKHNFVSKDQIGEYTASIRNLREDIFICVDHEGGRIQRFKDGFTLIPPMGDLGVTYQHDKDQALENAYDLGVIIGNELKSVGVDFTFAPVLDLDYGKSSIIGDRAFHADPRIVSNLADAFIDGIHDQSMPVCGKHFPGHGFVTPDSHIADPLDNRTLAELLEADIMPYAHLNNKLDAIMTAHILFPAVDDEIVTYSSVWLKDILREKLGYEGMIISDDLVMHAAAKMEPIQRVTKALQAGCDYILYCQDYEGIDQILS